MKLDSKSRILVIRLSAIGDVARTFSAVAQLRKHYPQAFIAWLVEEKSASILEDDPTLNEVILFPRKKLAKLSLSPSQWLQFWVQWWNFSKKLKQYRFDIVFDFHGIFKSGILGWITRAKTRVGYCRRFVKEGNWLFTNKKIIPASSDLNRYDRNLELIKPWTSSAQPDPIPLYISMQDQDKVSRFLSQLPDKTAQKNLIILHPGASKIHKKWFPERFAALADDLIEKENAFILLTWGPGEKSLAKEVFSAIRHPKKAALSPELSLKQLAELASRARLFISTDSGPMHIAAAMGAKQIALFGPTDPKVNHPNNPKAMVVYHPVPCSPCRKGCLQRICMQQITVEEIILKAREKLQNS